jgi:hypothetical protein
MRLFKKMKKPVEVIFASAVLVSLGGCVSTQEALVKPPTNLLTSSLSPRDIDFCLANRFAGFPVVRQDREDGTKIFMLKNTVTNGFVLALSIIPSGQGSRIEFRKGQGGLGLVRTCLGTVS